MNLFKDMMSIIISPKDLLLTNEDLDEAKLASMTTKLQEGKLLPENLTKPLITPVKGGGYMVADGNHSVKAMQDAGVKRIEAEVFKLKG